jgi:4-hydroxybenzoate polyprenyltransferase
MPSDYQIAMLEKIRTLGGLIKFSHSVFALPFALMMIVVIDRVATAPSFFQMLVLVLCVVAARSAAMGFNRLVDAKIDRLNPRTATREIPAGRVSRGEAIVLVVASSALFILGSASLGGHCAVLAPPVLLILFGYSYMKRVSSSAHFVLGLSLAMAPGGVWYALTATWSWLPIPLMLCVLFWVAGFDILYACQDEEFDRLHGLHSVPSAIGLERARALAAMCHILALISLATFGYLFGLGATFWLGYLGFGGLIVSQHITVALRGIGCIDQVFFTRNGLASVALLIFTTLDRLVTGS